MPKRVALVVGIGHYEYHHALETCPTSAKESFRLLISPEYGKCDPDRSILKTVEEGESLTAPDLYRAIRDIIHSLQEGDQFIFFFSGHAELHHDRLFLTTTESEKPQQGYRFSNLIDNLHDNYIDKAIIVIDACHSGAMFDSIKNLQSSEWKPHDLPKGFGFMAAGSRYETASQVQELGYTLFSYYFCEGITSGIKTEGQYITLPGLRKYINSQTKRNFRGRRQRVHTWVCEGDAELWLSKNVTPKTDIISDGFERQSKSNRSSTSLVSVIFLLFVVLATLFTVYRNVYQPSIGVQVTVVALRATNDKLAEELAAASISRIVDTPTHTPSPTKTPIFTTTPVPDPHSEPNSFPPQNTPAPTNTARPTPTIAQTPQATPTLDIVNSFIVRGNDYLDANEYEKAIESYNEAIDFDPTYVTAYINRGVAYSRLQRYDRAIDDFTRAIELDHDNTTAYFNRSASYINIGVYDLAISDINRLIDLDPENSDAYANRAFAYSKLGGYAEQAIEDYTIAIELDPDNAHAYNNRGLVYQAIGDSEKEIEDFKMAIDIGLRLEDATVIQFACENLKALGIEYENCSISTTANN